MSDQRANVEVKIGSERNFGIVFAVVFFVIGLWPLLGGENARRVILFAGAGFFVLAFVAPGVLRYPNRLWFKCGTLLGAIVAPLVPRTVHTYRFQNPLEREESSPE